MTRWDCSCWGAMQVWPEIIEKAKEGGIDVIETYVFWNYHEPVKGQVYICNPSNCSLSVS